jgi:hypothetical protein
MTDYILHLSYFGGIVPGSTHFRGRVEGPYVSSCHGGTHTGPDTEYKTACAEGHILPDRINWEVEAPWSEERYERWAAGGFDGDQPTQFTDVKVLIETAIKRFLNQTPEAQWFEDKFVAGQPGDRLYLDFIPSEDEMEDKAWGDLIGAPPYGSLLATVPSRVPTEVVSSE